MSPETQALIVLIVGLASIPIGIHILWQIYEDRTYWPYGIFWAVLIVTMTVVIDVIQPGPTNW